MTTSLHFWLRLSMLFLGLWGCGWAVSVAWRRRRENGLISPIVTMSVQIKQKARTVLTNTAKIGLGTALGILLGMAIREHQLLNSTITYSAVFVQRKISDQRFLMQPQWMRVIDSELCPGSLVDWRPGETLQDWTFEQRQGCKRVISYHRYLKGENLNAAIQMR